MGWFKKAKKTVKKTVKRYGKYTNMITASTDLAQKALGGGGGLFGSEQESEASGSNSGNQSSSTSYAPYDPQALSRLQGYAGQSSDLANQLSGMDIPYTRSLYGANASLLPKSTEASQSVLDQIINETRSSMPMAAEFYKRAQEGVDPLQRANEAEAETVSAFDKAREAQMRNLGRYGISPQNMEKDERVRQIEEAKAIAGARTGAANLADRESWAKLVQAMGSRGQGLSSLYDTTRMYDTNSGNMNNILQALSLAGNLTTPGLTPQRINSTGNYSGNYAGTRTDTNNPSLWDIGKTLVGGTVGFM